MAPLVVSIEVDRPIADRGNSFQIVAVATDCDIVYAVINSRVFQLETRAQNTWVIRLHPNQIGNYTGTFKVYALKTSTGQIDDETGPSVTVTEISPIMPAEYMCLLYSTGGSYKWQGQEFLIVTDRDERRVDVMNQLGIVVTEGKALRENVSRHHYKTVKYPLMIQVYHHDSYAECKRLFGEHVLEVEEYNLNLDGEDGFNWIEILDDGRPLPYVNIYSIQHNINLVQVLKKVEIMGT